MHVVILEVNLKKESQLYENEPRPISKSLNS